MSKSLEVRPAGARGSHGCSGYLFLEGEPEKIHQEPDYPELAIYRATGRVVQVGYCPTCGANEDIKVGEVITVTGWIRPDYYGFDGIQA